MQRSEEQTMSSTLSRLLRVDFPSVQTRLNAEEEAVVIETLRNGPTWSQGEEQRAFEREFTQYIGCADSIAVSSCTSALEMAAALCGLAPGDEVILPAHTFVSSAVPFARTGARLVFADIDPATRLLSAEFVKPCLTERTKAMVVVHLYGLPADMDPILRLAEEHHLKVVEDVAQAPGAVYKGRKAGSMGDFAAFSFHNQKNISTLGEGGMLTVRNPADGERARKLRWMGNWPFAGDRGRYWVPAMGNLVSGMQGVWPFNFCLSEVQCAVGRRLLRRLDAIDAQRRAQADLIRSALADVPELSFQQVPEGHVHAYHLLVAHYDSSKSQGTRDDLIQRLHQDYGIKCIVQYWPLYRSELFQSFGYGNVRLPNTDEFFDNMISFPFWSDMPEATLHYMADGIRAAVESLRRRGQAEPVGFPTAPPVSRVPARGRQVSNRRRR